MRLGRRLLVTDVYDDGGEEDRVDELCESFFFLLNLRASLWMVDMLKKSFVVVAFERSGGWGFGYSLSVRGRGTFGSGEVFWLGFVTLGRLFAVLMLDGSDMGFGGLKMFANWRIACCCSVCSGERRLVLFGLVDCLIACVRSLAAAMMRSVFDAVGRDIPWGIQLTVSETRSELVLVIHTLWHW
jgi:hypothetical protein